MKIGHNQLLYLLFCWGLNFLGFGQAPSPITLSQGKFISDGKPWFALSVNYRVDLFTDDETTFWVGPHHGYNAKNQRCCQNQSDARMALFADFARIREMGFNTIRIYGMELYANSSSADKKLWATGKKGSQLENIQLLSSKKNNKILASMAKVIVEEAHDAGLQVIFLTGGANLQRNRVRERYNEWLETLCDTLKALNPIFAIDIYNEPIYSTSSMLNKTELHEITKTWYSTIKKRLPKTLITIGLVGPEDVAGWDPEALQIDFVNYHLYPLAHDYEYVASALYWISQTAKKPWIIGETGYSGSNDSTQSHRQGTEADQRKYALFSMNRALCRGAQGYSWWAYHDVFWNTAEDNMGLLTYAGKEKEIVAVFKSYEFTQRPSNCPNPDDLHYYKMEFSDYIIHGIIENKAGKPIANAVVCGWDKEWKNFRWTVTDKNGAYRLGSKTPVKFVKASATGYSVISRAIGDVSKDIKLNTIVLSHWSEVDK